MSQARTRRFVASTSFSEVKEEPEGEPEVESHVEANSKCHVWCSRVGIGCNRAFIDEVSREEGGLVKRKPRKGECPIGCCWLRIN